MIANITYGGFTKGLINYHKKKVEVKQAAVFHSNLSMAEHLSYSNIEHIFNSYTALSKRKNKNFHVSLNFKEADYKKLDDTGKKLLINDYLHKVGFPDDHPFISFQHFDKKHPHIHVIAPNILENGKALNDSNIFIRSRKISRELEMKYNLSNAENQEKLKPDKQSFDFISIRKDYDAKTVDLKTYLKTSVNNYLKIYKPTSKNEFIEGLKKIGIYTYFTNHKKPGLIYTANNNNTELKAKDTGIKSSALSKNLTFKAVQSTFDENKKEKQELAAVLSGKIDFIFNKFHKISIPDFEKELKKYDITLKYNYSGKNLSGISFNYKNRHFKGQELPKREYTYVKLKEHFSETSSYSQNYIISLILFKNGLHKPEKYTLEDYTLKLSKLGIVPYLTPYGIKLSLKNTNEKQVGIPSYFITQFNETLKTYSDTGLDELNKKILKHISTDKHIVNIPNLPSFSLLSFFDNLFGDTGDADFQEEEETNLQKRKKYLKRNNL